MRPVDLRSDTVTRPTHAMRRAMALAARAMVDAAMMGAGGSAGH